MSIWVIPAICAIVGVHVAFGVVIAAARYQRAGELRDAGVKVL